MPIDKSDYKAFNNDPTPMTASAKNRSEEWEKKMRKASLAYVLKELLAWCLCATGLILLAYLLARIAVPLPNGR